MFSYGNSFSRKTRIFRGSKRNSNFAIIDIAIGIIMKIRNTSHVETNRLLYGFFEVTIFDAGI